VWLVFAHVNSIVRFILVVVTCREPRKQNHKIQEVTPCKNKFRQFPDSNMQNFSSHFRRSFFCRYCPFLFSLVHKHTILNQIHHQKPGFWKRNLRRLPNHTRLFGTYYSLKDNQNSILMFNNKAPQPLVVNPIFFSMSGERFEIPALTIGAISYQEFDLRDLLANAPAEFQEGSVQVTHQGIKQQLGVQVKILKLERGLIFDEQFVEPTKRFVSSRLESVWWLPSSQPKTKLIVSNTTDLPVTATVKVDGTAPRQQHPTTIQLNAHQTRALDILQDLVGQQQGGTIHREGGISITHSGTPGAILARMLVSKENTGFSTASILLTRKRRLPQNGMVRAIG